jgi:hypothetical protein
MMIDIWIADRFYVIQIHGDMIGLSLITKETPLFEMTPDYSFKDARKFKKAFEKIF